MGKADLHIHTTYSKDATTTVRGVLKQAALIGLDVIAITDHNEIRGALEARELASQYNLEVITGVEVGTAEGHVVALFVDKPMPKGLSLIDTLLRIGDFGGIAIAEMFALSASEQDRRQRLTRLLDSRDWAYRIHRFKRVGPARGTRKLFNYPDSLQRKIQPATHHRLDGAHHPAPVWLCGGKQFTAGSGKNTTDKIE
jgi:hypothetical protein